MKLINCDAALIYDFRIAQKSENIDIAIRFSEVKVQQEDTDIRQDKAAVHYSEACRHTPLTHLVSEMTLRAEGWWLNADL